MNSNAAENAIMAISNRCIYNYVWVDFITLTLAHAQVYAYLRTHAHIQTLAHTHTLTHTHTHIHTNTQKLTHKNSHA